MSQSKMLSLRYLWFCGLGGVAVLIPIGLIFAALDAEMPSGLAFVLWGGATGIIIAKTLNSGIEYYCPKCGKRMKASVGATRCHHCGYDIPQPEREKLNSDVPDDAA